MSRVVPSERHIDEQYAWTSWLTAYENGLKQVKPKCRSAGILGDLPTATPNFRIPIPPLGSGQDTEGEDGNDWMTDDPRVYFVSGLAFKQGLRGLRFRELDLYENYVAARRMNAIAYGRSEVLWEDRKVAECLELGFKPSVRVKEGIRELTVMDGKPVFAKDHPFDPINDPSGDKGSYTNTFDLALTPDNFLKVRDNFYSIKDEIGNQIFDDDDVKFVLVVPPFLKSDAQKVLDRERISDVQTFGSSVDNIAYKQAQLLVLPQLKDRLRWYVLVVNQTIEPVVRIGLKPMTRIEIGPNSDLWKRKQLMKWFSYERADYRIVDARLVATSRRAS
jgi:hypothetical protein